MGDHSDTSRQEAKVLLILAGGTICMQASEEGYVPTKGLLGKCLAGHDAFDDGSHPPALQIVDENGARRTGDASLRLPGRTPSILYTAFEFETLIDSSSADARYWNTIAQCIASNYAHFDGFVVLHGTDTLAYAASALSFALHPLAKPVILTGSQVSIFDDPSDAWDNILGSLIVAGQELVQEVCLFFHRTLFRGNRAVKIHASEYAAFSSPNLEPLAHMDESSTTIIRGSTSASLVRDNDVNPLDALVKMNSEEVAVLRVYPGLRFEALEAVLAIPSLKGLILETFGAGNMPKGVDGRLLRSLTDAVTRGMVIVNISQCLNGTVSPFYAPARALEKIGVVYGHDMTTEAAYSKLLFLLASPSLTVKDVRALMARNLYGELTVKQALSGQTDGPTERRSSLSVTSLQWTQYTPAVSGRRTSKP